MDKEAQLKEIAKTAGKYHIGCGLPIECYSKCGACLAKAIWELGYRKPPDRTKLREKITERIKAHFRAEGFVSQAEYDAHVNFLADQILALIPDKLPEGKPPLLSDEEIAQVYYTKSKPSLIDAKGVLYPDYERAFCEAQYNSIMEHLGLPFRVRSRH